MKFMTLRPFALWRIPKWIVMPYWASFIRFGLRFPVVWRIMWPRLVPISINPCIRRSLVLKENMWSFKFEQRRCTASMNMGLLPIGCIRNLGKPEVVMKKSLVGFGSLWSGTKIFRTIGSSWIPWNWIYSMMWSSYSHQKVRCGRCQWDRRL